VCQNLYLAAEAVQCGVCAIAAYDDEALNAALQLDGEALFVIYLASLGKK
jgi:nitroreductase